MLDSTDTQNYGFQDCMTQLDSVNKAINLANFPGISNVVGLLSAKTNKTTAEACGWVESYINQLEKDTGAAEVQMREGLELHRNLRMDLDRVRNALGSYSPHILEDYKYNSVVQKIRGYLVGNISKIELVRGKSH